MDRAPARLALTPLRRPPGPPRRALCACRKVAADVAGLVAGRGGAAPCALRGSAALFACPGLGREPLSFSVTRATGSSWLRFCCFGAGVVSRGWRGAFPHVGVVGQPSRGGPAGGLVRPLGVAVVLHPSRGLQRGAAVAAASVRLPPARPQARLPKRVATWHSKRTRSHRCPCTSACDALFQACSAANRWLAFNPCIEQAPQSLGLQHTARSSAQTRIDPRQQRSHAAPVYAATSSARLSRPRRGGAGPARRLWRRRRLRRAAAPTHGAGPRRAAGHRPSTRRRRPGRQAGF